MKKITPKDFTILHNNLGIIISLYNECNKDKILMKYLFEKYPEKMKELLVFCKKLKENDREKSRYK